MELLIRNGTIVNADQSVEADIRIIDHSIAETGPALSPSSDKTRVIEAHDRLIFPGGIDPHVHLHLPSPAGYSSDDFLSGSKAALAGGTTAYIDFVTPEKGQRLEDALGERKKESEKSLTNPAFHVSPIEWRDSMPEEIKACVALGIKSFKVYMAYLDTIGLNDTDLKKVMKAVADAGAMVTVHCELGEEVNRLQDKYIREGKTAPRFHPLSRPNEVEANAVKKAIQFASETGCPLYIVHVSAKESLLHIREAQQKGQSVFAETCPQYLLFDDSNYTGVFKETAPFVMSPPLRKKADNEALWQALADGTIQTVGTDHCPFTLNQKKYGLDDFTKIPNGAGGIEHRLTLLYTFGVLTNRISINRFVELLSTKPAKIFGLYKKKGIITEGSDADLVVWNRDRESVISVKTHRQQCDINIYEGTKTKGAPEYIILDGHLHTSD